MKKIVALMLTIAMCLTMFGAVYAAEMNFTDVKKADWFYNDVKTAVESGLVNGKSATSYAPEDNLTYAEAIKLAACMNQLYVDGAITLSGGDPWYKPYVDYCTKKGIITTTYNYDSFATRAGYMGIFANALPDDGLKAINSVADDSIPDVPTSKAYAPGVYKLYRAGILQGVDAEHNCNPLANITRAEVAAILTRMMNEDARVKFSMGSTSSSGGSGGGGGSSSGGSTTTASLKVRNLTGDELEIPDLTEGYVEVKATGGKEPYAYKWEYNYDGRWITVAFAGGDQYTFTGEKNTDTLEILVSVDDDSADMKIRCTVTDANGDSVTSDETHVTAYKETSGGIKDKFEQGDSEEPEKDDFLMYVEDVFTITGRGVVATGRVVNGSIKTGDGILIVSEDGSMMEATVAGIEMFHKMLDEAKKGDNIGLLFDSEVTKDDVSRGDSLIAENSSYDVYEEMIGTLSLTSKEEGGRTTAISEGFEASFYRSGHDFPAKITGLNDGTMNPGETQDKVTVTTNYFRGVFYRGQVLEVRQAGRKIGTFTIDAFSSGGGRESIPTGKTEYIDQEAGGRQSNPSGKSQYMD